MVFGGIIFLVIGVRYVLLGPAAIEQLRGEPEHIAGSVAMPFMIGPGTISASVWAGSNLSIAMAVAAIGCALVATVMSVFILKFIHDYVRQHNESLVERYVDVVGRVSALIIGTFAVDMILSGMETWIENLT